VVAVGLLGYALELVVSRSATRQLTFYWARLLGVGSFVGTQTIRRCLCFVGLF